LFVAIPGFQAMFRDMGVDLPVLTSLVLFPGGIGWVLLFLVLAAGITLKDIGGKASTFPNWVFALVLIVLVCGLVVALFVPLTLTLSAVRT
jgi:type II secretory pathway component PulF